VNTVTFKRKFMSQLWFFWNYCKNHCCLPMSSSMPSIEKWKVELATKIRVALFQSTIAMAKGGSMERLWTQENIKKKCNTKNTFHQGGVNRIKQYIAKISNSLQATQMPMMKIRSLQTDFFRQNWYRSLSFYAHYACTVSCLSMQINPSNMTLCLSIDISMCWYVFNE